MPSPDTDHARAQRGAAPPGAQGLRGPLAETLRALRAERRLTLQQLSERSGISASTLSKIETGKLSPTYEKIVALAGGLGVEAADLFGGGARAAGSGRRGVTRRGEGVWHASPQYDYEMLCTDLSGKQFMPIRARIKARSITQFRELLRHEGEEFVYVLTGEVCVHSEFYEPFVLRRGDCCYFDSKMGHALVAGGAQDAEVLWICSRHVAVAPPAPPGPSARGSRRRHPDSPDNHHVSTT